MADETGRLIAGRYVLLEVVGEGAMGTVWRAHDRLLDREVAVKEIVPPPGLSAAEQAAELALARDEASAAGRLSHPGIIAIYDVIDEGGTPCIVMELIRGRSLAAVLREEVRLPWRRAAEIGSAVLDALRVAHAAGVVHQDLKPANILIAGDRVVITDFGVAQREGTRTGAKPGEVTGTPAFVAPEQADGIPVSPAADLWSLGAMLFNITEGRPPFPGPDHVSVLLALLTQDPPAPRAAGPLTELITELLRKDPARRATLDRAAEFLDRALNTSPPHNPPPPAPSSVPPSARSSAPTVPSSVPLSVQGSAPAAQASASSRSSAAARALASAASRRSAIVRSWLTRARVVALVAAAIVLVGPLLGWIDPMSHSVRRVSVPAAPQLDGLGPVSVAASHDGKVLAAAYSGFVEPITIKLFDVRTHAVIAAIRTDDTDSTTALAFSPDDSMLALAGGAMEVRLFDVRSHVQSGKPSFADVAYTAAFTPDGGSLQTADDTGEGTRMDLRTGKRTDSPQGIDQIACDDWRLSPDWKDFACADGDGHIKLFDAAAPHGAPRHVLRVSGTSGYGTELTFGSDSTTLAVSVGALSFWNVETGRQYRMSGPDADTSAESLVGLDAHHAVTVRNGAGGIVLWTFNGDSATSRRLTPAITPSFDSCALSQDGALLACHDLSGFYLWSTATAALVTHWS